MGVFPTSVADAGARATPGPPAARAPPGSLSSRRTTKRSAGPAACLDAPEPVDRVEVPASLLVVAHAAPLLGRQAEHPDLALVGVGVYVERGLADVLERVAPRQGRVDHALVDQPVGLPRLAVVREVRADDPLEVHPQVAVVVLVHEAAGRGAGHDRAALARGINPGAR